MLGSSSIPKAWVGLPRGLGRASRFTSVGSILAHRYPNLGRHTIPRLFDLLAPGATPRLLGTTNVYRWIGRWIPGIGWALLAADLIVIDQCVAQCRGQRSVLRAICEELTPFCAKPAW